MHIHLEAIHHIAIIVSDMTKAKDFYVDKLGFAVIREQYRANHDDWMLNLRVDENTELEIFVKKDAPKRMSYPEACGLRHLAFKVDEVEQTVQELATMGIVCEPVRYDSCTGAKMTFFFDPDGLPIEIRE